MTDCIWIFFDVKMSEIVELSPPTTHMIFPILMFSISTHIITYIINN